VLYNTGGIIVLIGIGWGLLVFVLIIYSAYLKQLTDLICVGESEELFWAEVHYYIDIRH